MKRALILIAVLAITATIIVASVGPNGALWDRPAAWIGLTLFALGLAMHSSKTVTKTD